MDNMTLTEEDKNGVYVYSLKEALERFNGKVVDIVIKEQIPVIPSDEVDTGE